MTSLTSSLATTAAAPDEPVIATQGLPARAGTKTLLRNATFRVARNQVLGVIGPSGAGKSTLLRCLNRLNDLIPGMHVQGEIRLNGASIYDVDVNTLRARVGMLFQQPVVFPASISENVLFGVKRLRSHSKPELQEILEAALRETALWDEVKDRLKVPASNLSVGQQQRLCLARTLAGNPEVILMDEPTSALDPKATQAIEELILRLKQRHTIVIVTHNIRQARKVADWIACICVREGAGEIVECAAPGEMFDNPQCCEVVDYLQHAP